MAGLVASGIEVADVVSLRVGHTPYNHDYLVTKMTEMGHLLDWVTAEEGSTP